MRIIAENEEEKQCIKSLLQNLEYAFQSFGQDTDAFYKAFEYVNDNPTSWKDGELVNDLQPKLARLLQTIGKTSITMEEKE